MHTPSSYRILQVDSHLPALGHELHEKLAHVVLCVFLAAAMDGPVNGERCTYEAKLLPTSALDECGRTVEGKWKAFLYDDGPVFWELRRVVLDCLNGARQNLELSKIVKNVQESGWRYLELLGTDFEQSVIPSFKACCSRDEEAIVGPLVRSEWTVSTKGLVAWLVLWAASSHDHERRQRVDALLRAWLSKAVDPSLANPSAWSVWLLAVGGRCEQDPDHRGLCSHLACVITDVDLGDGLLKWRYLATVLLRLFGLGTACPAAVAFQSHLVDAVVKSIHGRLDDIEWESDISKFPLLQGSKRKLRIDEDYKREVGQGLVGNKRVHSGAQFARATGDVAACTARQWDGNYMLQYRAACKATCELGEVLWLSSDASRIGQPAEETTVCLAWDHSSNRGVILPPQARVVSLTCAPPWLRGPLA